MANFLWHIKNEPSASERILRQSLAEYQSANVNWIRTLGNVVRAQERWDEALVEYERALELNPDALYTLQLIGETYMLGLSNSEKASEIFYAMVVLAPESGIGYFELGRLMAEMERFDEADQWFAEAIERNPDEPWWWVVRANTAREAQNLPLALDIFNTAVERFPNYSMTYYEMAWAYKLNDQPAQAIEAINNAIRSMNTQNVWYYLRAGSIFEWAGEIEIALDTYNKVLSIENANPLAVEIAERGIIRLEGEGMSDG